MLIKVTTFYLTRKVDIIYLLFLHNILQHVAPLNTHMKQPA
jgi:hypothetical protein